MFQMLLNQILRFENTAKIINIDKEFAKLHNFKGVKFPIYWVMKTKHNTIFILQSKLFKNMFIYDYYQILQVPVMF